MHHDTPEWRIKNACAPCRYVLEDEPPLIFGVQCEMDGGNSLKRADECVQYGSKSEDKRKPRTDYWQTPEEVDVYKDEVKVRSKGKVCVFLYRFQICLTAESSGKS